MVDLSASIPAGLLDEITVHLIPAVGQVALQQLTTAMLNALYKDLLERGTGPRSTSTPPSARRSTTRAAGAC